MMNYRVYLSVGCLVVAAWCFALCGAHLSRPIDLPSSGQVFDVMSFGAVGDGKTKDTIAIVKAVTMASESGGGYIFFPPGQYLTGAFNLSSNCFLYLDEGATLLGSTDPNDFPVIPPLPSYGTGRDIPGPRYSSIVHGQNLTNVGVIGMGTIDGQGQSWWELKQNGSLLYSRPGTIEFMWSQNIVIENITILNSPFWTIHPVYSENVLIQNVTINNPSDSPNTDGIDPDSCANVLVTKCNISVGDDCIAVKSGLDQWGREYNWPCVNVTIENTNFFAGHGLTIGSEMSGGVYNVTFKNNYCRNLHTLVRLKTSNTRGSEVKNITWLNHTGENIGSVFSFTTVYTGGGSEGNSSGIDYPILTDFLVENLKVTGAHQVSLFECQTHIPCEDMTLINIDVTEYKEGWYCSSVYGTGSNISPSIPQGCLDGMNVTMNFGVMYN